MNKAKKSKSLAVVVSLLAVLCLAIGGTMAWLVADTDPVENTFTYGDINLNLDETKTDEKGTPIDKDNDGNADKTTEGNEYEMLPGEEYLKDPEITVEKGNEACWLFVKLTEEGEAPASAPGEKYDFDDYLKYEVAEGWTALKIGDHESVYYRHVAEDTNDEGVTYKVLKDDKIEVKEAVTKDMLNALDNSGKDIENAKYPKLTVKGYAIQYSGFEAASESKEDMTKAADLAWNAIENQK